MGAFAHEEVTRLNNGKKKKPVSPIYTIGIIFVIMSILGPIGSLGRLVLTGILGFFGYSVVKAIISSRQAKSDDDQTQRAQEQTAQQAAQPRQQTQTQTARPKKEEPKYPPEVQAVVDEGRKAHAELQHLYASIPDLSVKKKIVQIMDISDKITDDAIHDPSDVPQIKKFQDYYLPTTIKLLNAYDRMGAQGIEGSNITGTMNSINEMLDTAIEAYKKLLDSLFANQAMDIETDIEVMNTLLKREGLTGENAGFTQTSGGGAAAFAKQKGD